MLRGSDGIAGSHGDPNTSSIFPLRSLFVGAGLVYALGVAMRGCCE